MKPIQPVVFIIWVALCFALIAYAVMLSAITFVPAKAAHASLTNIFALVTGCSAVLTFFLRKLLLGGFITGTQRVDDAIGRGRFLVGHVVIFALSEGVGVLGLVNGLNSNGGGEAWVPFIGGALILMLLHIPLWSRFKSLA